jgi:hypothetical protein
MKKYLRTSGFTLLALLIFGLVGFLVWASTPSESQPEATQSLNDSPEADFTITNGWLVFSPVDAAPTTGLILYPGARVDPRAYAPQAQAIAAAGFKVVIVPMPLNFAFLGINLASQVINANPEIENWAVGGHSLGGAMAAEFVHSHSQEAEGLVLWAAYPAQNTDLSMLNIEVISIYATNDGLASPDEVRSAGSRLPVDTRFVEITGGNHAGFGWYGPQNGDGKLEIAKSTQQRQVVDATAGFLSELEYQVGR